MSKKCSCLWKELQNCLKLLNIYNTIYVCNICSLHFTIHIIIEHRSHIYFLNLKLKGFDFLKTLKFIRCPCLCYDVIKTGRESSEALCCLNTFHSFLSLISDLSLLPGSLVGTWRMCSLFVFCLQSPQCYIKGEIQKRNPIFYYSFWYLRRNFFVLFCFVFFCCKIPNTQKKLKQLYSPREQRSGSFLLCCIPS